MEKKMKKLALSAILGASLMITSSAFALTSMSSDSMKSATGQAGVSITLDNVVIEQFIGETVYTDADGYDGNGGSIVISNKHVIKGYNALTSLTDFTTSGYTAGLWKKAAALSIDVGNCSILMAGNNANKNAIPAALRGAITAAVGTLDKAAAAAAIMALEVTVAPGVVVDVADNIALANGLYEFSTAATAWSDLDVVGVVIGLPTLEITTSADTYDVGVRQTDAINDGCNFINVSKGASRMAIISGVVEIAAH